MRYERQIEIGEIGSEGQEKLRKSHIAVVGCGGLGSPVLTYLACAGVGTLTLIDCDTVSESNLNRQFLHTGKDLGREKTASAQEKLQALNPEVRLVARHTRIDEENAGELLGGADVVVDCVDNLAARMLVNRTCLRLDIPLVEGGIAGFYGFVMAIRRESACLECAGYTDRQGSGGIPVLGATAGVIGSLQCMEALKIVLGLPGVLYGEMLHFDGLHMDIEVVEIAKSEECVSHNTEPMLK